jgi:addiction module RelE/StbE family toxin
MTKRWSVVYLPIAVKDLDEIFEYIKKDNPKAATEFVGVIEKAIGGLETFPFKGVVPKDERLRLLGYRILIIDPYLVFYIVDDSENCVEIRRIIHGKRRYSFLL